VAPHERGYEDLIVTRELSERWQRETAFDSDIRFHDPNAFDLHDFAAG
jgi:hypothetical protein